MNKIEKKRYWTDVAKGLIKLKKKSSSKKLNKEGGKENRK